MNLAKLHQAAMDGDLQAGGGRGGGGVWGVWGVGCGKRGKTEFKFILGVVNSNAILILRFRVAF